MSAVGLHVVYKDPQDVALCLAGGLSTADPESPLWCVRKHDGGPLREDQCVLLVARPAGSADEGQAWASAHHAVRAALWRCRRPMHRLVQQLVASGGQEDWRGQLPLVVRLRCGGAVAASVGQQLLAGIRAFSESLEVDAASVLRKQKRKAPIKGAKTWEGQHSRPGSEGAQQDARHAGAQALVALSAARPVKRGKRPTVPVITDSQALKRLCRQEGDAATAGAGGARGRIVYTAAVPKDPSQEGRAMGITALVEQGRGVLHVSGNVTAHLASSAHVARSFLRIHEGWLRETFGELAISPSSGGHDIRLHVDETLLSISGLSAGAAFLVVLADLYLGRRGDALLRALQPDVAVLGTVSLSGGMGCVAGLERKLSAIVSRVTAAAVEPLPKDKPLLVAVVGMDNVITGRLLEPSLGSTVRVPASLGKAVEVLAVSNMFECLATLLRPSTADPLALPSPGTAADDGCLAVIKAFLPDRRETWAGYGRVVLVECARLSPGAAGHDSEQRTLCTPSLPNEVEGVMTLAAAWVRNEWAAVRAAVGAGEAPAGHNDGTEGPPDAALHFNVTGDLVNGCVGLAAALSACVVLTGEDGHWRGLSELAVIGEVDAMGGVTGRVVDSSDDAEMLLRLSQWNGVKLLVLPASESGRWVLEMSQRRAKMYAGVEVVLVRSILEAAALLVATA